MLAGLAESDPLFIDVKTNRALAERLLSMAPPDPDPSVPEPESGDGPQVNERGMADSNPGKVARPDGHAERGDGKQSPTETDRPSPPGAGKLPPLPDVEALAALPPEDFAAHLDRAAKRIAAARRDRLKLNERTKPPGYPDW